MKTISLLKAALSQDMNMFKYKAKESSNKITKIIFPIILFLMVSMAIGTYAYMFGKELSNYHLTYIMISLFIIFVTIITFIEGIYKSQGILFDSKDNELLFSLPIKKHQILFVRIFKLLLFEYLYNLMFLLPAFVVLYILKNQVLTFI